MAIDITCNGHLDNENQPTHEAWIVARWHRIDGQWASTRRVSQPGEALRLLKGKPDQLLHDDALLSEFADWRTDARARYRFECHCGLVVAVKKPNLVRVLDTLEAHSVSSIALRDLDARLH